MLYNKYWKKAVQIYCSRLLFILGGSGMDQPRSSGILLHPTSLPGRFGIGDLGDAAYRWIDFLVASEQTLWQVLPLGPTGYADSPYACLSAFAGNPLLINLDRLTKNGDLTADDLSNPPRFPEHKVDYGAVINYKLPLLWRAAHQFLSHASPDRRAEYETFCSKNASWLDDFALFMALKEYHKQAIWYEWGPTIALRRPDALARWQAKLDGQVAIQKVLQFFFFDQWQAIKAYANARGIRIVGDVPVFVAADSADVWANRGLFYLDENGRPTLISGVPPDYFSETGQRWGNPLYRWDVIAEQGYRWWIARMETILEMVDIVRIDHFRGFVAYWEIPASEPTAIQGRWVEGPQAELFQALKKALGNLPIWAEDLGVITPQVIGLREQFGFPGMKILQFAFDQEALYASFGDYDRNPFLPHNYTPNFVVYTGTHDNDTTLGWFNTCAEQERQRAMAYLGCDESEFNWSLIRAAMASVAQTAMVPLQDILGLGTKARMNLPGTSSNNWIWRYSSSMLTTNVSERLKRMTTIYERAPASQLSL
jgi:4-alpha-glucanotransferase